MWLYLDQLDYWLTTLFFEHVDIFSEKLILSMEYDE